MAITLKQAQALKPGDRLWALNHMASYEHHIEWEVYIPEKILWNHKDIICYLRQPKNHFNTGCLWNNAYLRDYFLELPKAEN